ncbi:zinc finger protein [Streptoalloteichus hindustanus]|uniref:Zinc-finger n=1 Tax=Streptoalloteichus hindustanus TaxID=2017 RepID=A0A1M4Z7B2_STRHI|nr:zinc-finger [Streptoalloteichus hindustanus]
MDFTHTWLPCGGERHAYPGEKRADGKEVTTYCGLVVSVTTYGDPRMPERLWPECDTCREKAAECADRRERAVREMRRTLHAYGDRPPCRRGY